MTHIFIDMDGVLAGFDAHYAACFGTRSCKEADNVDWELVRQTPNFYANIPPMSDMGELWAAVEHLRPTVLTGIPYSVAEAADNKRAWVARHLGKNIPVECCRSSEKYLYMRAAGDVLIDDWVKYRHLWERAGGVFVLHTSAGDSVSALRSLGILP